jgi:hypothetical protein
MRAPDLCNEAVNASLLSFFTDFYLHLKGPSRADNLIMAPATHCTFSSSETISEQQHKTQNKRLPSFQAPDPYDEAINALPSPVAHKLTRIFRDGVASRHDVDIHILDSLRDLPEQAAATVLDQFSSMDLRSVRSKGAYLDGEVARVRSPVHACRVAWFRFPETKGVRS